MSGPRCEATGKVAFTSIEAARRAMRHLDHPMRFYRCKHCHRWHAAKRER